MLSKKYLNNLLIKLIISTLFIIACFILIYFSFFNNNHKKSPQILNKKLTLGLDLQGGMQFLLSIDTEEYILKKISNLLHNIKKSMYEKNIDIKEICIVNKQIIIKNNSAKDKQIRDIVKQIDNHLEIKNNSDKLIIYYPKTKIENIQKELIAKSILIINSRIDKTGTKETTIQTYSNSKILLQVPGNCSSNKFKSLLGKTGKLGFYLSSNQSYDKNDSGILQDYTKNIKINNSNHRIYSTPVITGDMIKSSYISFNNNNNPIVNFSLNTQGEKIFSDTTKNNIGKFLFIIMDDKVISSPVINCHIPGGSGCISGKFNTKEATELSLILNSGSLPAPIKIIEEKIVGSSFGKESIKYSKKSAIIAYLLVSLFMILTYSFFGIISSLSLLFTLTIIIATILIFNITLTLPGIAGIILTFGMSVDSNIIIYEGIKNKIKNKIDKNSNIHKAFNISLKTIMDSNITSILSAVFLYSFGVGVIRGFAITFSIGIIASMFICFWFTKPTILLLSTKNKF